MASKLGCVHFTVAFSDLSAVGEGWCNSHAASVDTAGRYRSLRPMGTIPSDPRAFSSASRRDTLRNDEDR